MNVYKKVAGKDVKIGQINAGEVVGEMSFLDKEVRSATVIAMGECEVIVIASEKFEKLFESLPVWYKALVKTLLDRLRKANDRAKI